MNLQRNVICLKSSGKGALVQRIRPGRGRRRSKHHPLSWGALYNQFKDKEVDTDKLERLLAKLMQDDDVEKKSGIYPYVLDGDERHLNIRAFSDNMKREAYERQKGICVKCNKKFELNEMEADHIKPWHEAGKTTATNCQMLCKMDNRIKGGS